MQDDFWGPLLQGALKLSRGGFGKSVLVLLWLLGLQNCLRQELVFSPLLFVVLEDVTSNAVCHTQYGDGILECSLSWSDMPGPPPIPHATFP